MTYAVRLLFLPALVSTSLALAAEPAHLANETWTYSDCVNADHVPAHVDQSTLSLRGSTTNSDLELTWQTTLFQGFDEMMPTDSTGAVVPNSKPVADPKPVSASWKLLLSTSPFSSVYAGRGYPLVSGDFSALPALVRYVDSGKPEDRLVVVTQSLGNGEYWISAYTPSAMVRKEITLAGDKVVESTIARSCGGAAASTALAAKLGKGLLKDVPGGFIASGK